MNQRISAPWHIRASLIILASILGPALTLHELQAKPPPHAGGGGNSGGGNSGGGNSGGGNSGGGNSGGGNSGGGGSTIGSTDGSVTYYHLSSLDLGRDVTVVGPVVMVVDGDIELGNRSLDIGSGGSLQLYFGGNIRVGGKPGSGFNNSDVPAKMQLFGTHALAADDEPPEYEVKLHGNGAFTGVLYAPEVAYEKKGGGGAGFSQGSVVAKDIAFRGSPGPFHYDEALKDFEGPFESGTYRLSTYELLKAGDYSPSSEAETVIGNVDYDTLFDSLFSKP